MGTGGKRSWQSEANMIADKLNRALSGLGHVLGVDVARLRGKGSGVFELKAFDKVWTITIKPKEE